MTEEVIQGDYDEPEPPKGKKFVYICFSNVARMEGKVPWENKAAAAATGNDRTHVEIMFWSLNKTFTVTRRTKIVKALDKQVRPFYDVFRIEVSEAEYVAIMDYLNLQVGKEYDDEEFFCFIPSVFIYSLTCQLWAPCVSDDKITCTRLVGGALKSAGIANEYSDRDVYYMTCTDIERIIKNRNPVLLKGIITASSNVGYY